MLTVGLLGAGRIGRIHGHNVANHPRAKLAAIADASAEAAQALAANRRATTVERATAAGFLRDPTLNFFLERYAEAYRAELDAFVTGVLDGRELVPSGEDGLHAQRLADAATEAAESGMPVRLR